MKTISVSTCNNPLSHLFILSFMFLSLSFTTAFAQIEGVYKDGSEYIYRFRDNGNYETYTQGHKKIVDQGKWTIENNVLYLCDRNLNVKQSYNIRTYRKGFQAWNNNGSWYLEYLGENDTWDILALIIWALSD
jgi:hypothetical protein